MLKALKKFFVKNKEEKYYDTKTGIWTVKIGPSDSDNTNWVGSDTLHKFDSGLRKKLLSSFSNLQTFVDFGCGNADYARFLIENGKNVECYDGNPFTEEMTGGLGKILDLSEKFDLNNKFECVISLEVGEHIPKEKESIFIDNLTNHSSNYIIISWAIPGQGGTGHFNERENEYIINQFFERGFKQDSNIQNELRNSIIDLPWFKDTIMVFRKHIS